MLGPVALTVFLDIVGFSILFPLFPGMLEHYLALEGPASAVGRLATRLETWARGDAFAVVALFGGCLGSLYSLLQFLFAPVWGAISDRIGRRPTLLVTLLGTFCSHALWVFAGSFPLLIAARCLGGIMAGNIATASAVVADTTEGRDRARGMGILGMAIGLGFLCGPPLGALMHALPMAREGPWSAGLALNPYSWPAAAAALLGLANLVLVARGLPETLAPERRGSPAPGERVHVLNLVGQLRRLEAPGLRRTNVTYFLFLFAFAAMEFTLVFLTTERFGYGPRENGWMFVFIGLVVAGVQGGLVRRLAPRLGERRVSLIGLALLVPGFLFVAVAQRSAALYAGLAFLALGSALAMPCLSSLASRYSPADRQGLALGTLRALGALSRALGPLAGALLYWRFGSRAPYLSGALCLLLPLFLAWSLPPVPDEPAAPDGAGKA